EALRKVTPDGKQVYWQQSASARTTFYGRGQSGQVETTALAALALMQPGQHQGITNAALTWLMARLFFQGLTIVCILGLGNFSFEVLQACFQLPFRCFRLGDLGRNFIGKCFFEVLNWTNGSSKRSALAFSWWQRRDSEHIERLEPIVTDA